jgi:hypothetical protein
VKTPSWHFTSTILDIFAVMRPVLKFIVLSFFFFSFTLKHPFYLGVTEMKYTPKEKAIETTIKLFTNDLEDALQKIYKTKIDLINGKDKASLTIILTDYIKNHLKVKVNGKAVAFDFLGFEQEEEAVWMYTQYKNCPVPKKIEIDNSLLYDYLPSQINIVHLEAGDKKKSSKVTNPEKRLLFEFP